MESTSVMSHVFWIASVQIELEYRNVKTLRLLVYPPDGRVKISAPLGMDIEHIKKFAASKISWVKEKREKYVGNQAGKNSRLNGRTGPDAGPSGQIFPSGASPGKAGSLRNHSAVFVWGRAYELEIIERRGNHKIVLEDKYMKLYARPDSTRAKKLEYFNKWYSRILKEKAPLIIEKWEAVTGIKVKKLFVRKMKTKWGSCSPARQTLRLNSELAKLSPECLEFVIVHEMLHIIEKGHNKKFYRLLAKYIPDWKAIRKRMNSAALQNSQ